MYEEKYLEFKSEISNSFLKTVSAYANYGKGIIRFGINDDGSIKGINNIDKAKIDIENKINDSIDPKPDFTFIPDLENKTLDLVVFEGRFKPYMYKGRAYKRNDTSTVEMDRIELRRFIMDYNNTTFDELEINEELTFKYFDKVLNNSLNIKCDKNILKTFSLINNYEKYNNAAKIISDNNNLSGLDIVVYGDSINVTKQREIITGKSVFEMYDNALEIFKNNYTYEKIENFTRIKKELIPSSAFREALANALVHRSYDDKSNIRIQMFDDRIEVSSPGGLMPFLSKEEYLNGLVSKLRNPILAGVFLRLGLIEDLGSGIRRIKTSYRDTNVTPLFNVYENTIEVILPTIENVNLSSEELELLKVLNGYTLSSSELQTKLGFNKAKVIRLLNRLISKNIVKTTGNGKSTRYYSK